MSAWNIAGAAVWTPLAVWWTWRLWWAERETIRDNFALGLLANVALIFAAVFCIARICGAPA